MLGIAINNEFLELEPNTTLQLQLNNPFLQFDNQLMGDYSMPVNVRASPKNLRLLKFAGLLQQRAAGSGIDAAVYDDDLQHSIGKLKIDQVNHNLNRTNSGDMSLYYLSGVANFYQDIKYLYLRKIDLGGDRSFHFRINADLSWPKTGDGFWAHIHNVINAPVGSFDYAFFPVINKAWTGQDIYGTGTEMENQCMNWMYQLDGETVFHKLSTDGNDLNVIVPFPYLHYVLKQAVAAAGWNIDGTILDDPDFKKITMVNFQAIDWGYLSPAEWYAIHHFGAPPVGFHTDPIKFNLQDCMPDITVSDFLLALKNRFGWWYDFDRRSKTIHIRELQQVVNSTVKDFSKYASPLPQKKVSQDLQFYALKNEFVGDYADGAPQLQSLTVRLKGNHPKVSDLPAPTSAQSGDVYLVTTENNFYICRPDPKDTNNNTYTWQWYAYNVYDVIPVTSNIPPDYQVGHVDVPVVPVLQTPQTQVTDITTKATTLGSEPFIIPAQQPGAGQVDPLLDFVPRMDFEGNWGLYNQTSSAWSIHLLMYQGKQPAKNGQLVPFATSGIYNSQGQQVSAWALAFECKTTAGVDVGLYVRKWKPVLDTLQSGETITVVLSLPRDEFMQLQFSDTILIQGVKMYLSQIKPVIPYRGRVECEAIRL